MHIRNIRILGFLLMLIIAASGCRKQAWEEFYGRPESLEPPVYKLLEARGNFKSFLKAIDKAGYKTTLSTAGYWTIFAPHDSAFDAYLKGIGVAGVDQLDSVTCQKIVTYSTIYNGFNKSRIDDYQGNAGWIPNNAFRRRTANYTGVYDDVNKAGVTIKAIQSNRNNNGTFFYADADNNNKYVSIFTDTFFRAKALSAADYNYFYPATTFTGFNVLDGIVVESNLPAENGVVHIVNKVLVPLPSIDEYLRSKPEYSEFKKIFDNYLVEFVLNQSATEKYRNITGKGDNIFTKVFSPNLAYSLNNENFLKLQDNDGQANCYSIFAPENAPLLTYINNVLLEHYASVGELPRQVLFDFINAHLWQSAVWPTQFRNSFNFLGEPARFDPVADVKDRKLLSNGFFYGTNKVQESNLFGTVYGKVYLDPAYSYMNRMLDQEMKFIVSNPNQRFVLFMVSNEAWNKAGYFADATVDNNPAFQWRYIPANGGANIVGSSALVRMLRIINQHVVPMPSQALENMSGAGVARTYGNEFVRWDNGKVFASGNMDSTINFAANTLEFKRASNGTVFYIDRLLTYTENQVGRHIEKLGAAASSPYNHFWQYLNGSPLYTASTGTINGISAGVSYTIFAPTNAAILDAVRNGFLPGSIVNGNPVPNFRPTNPFQIELVTRFLQYHILNKVAVATDGEASGAYETLLRNAAGESTTIFVNNATVNAMSLTDQFGRIGTVNLNPSNYLSNRVVIHLVDRYLQYRY
jgi:uncharacterized surface protein with fasciclin (FAS1) repeats